MAGFAFGGVLQKSLSDAHGAQVALGLPATGGAKGSRIPAERPH
jgi:hypothetical protein